MAETFMDDPKSSAARQPERFSQRLSAPTRELGITSFVATPLNPVIGAEVDGLDLSQPLTHRQFEDVRAALNAYHVLIFRNQIITVDDHKRFARRFGKLHVHPYHAKNAVPEHAKAGVESDPEVLVVKADQKSRYVAGEGWHTDVTCDLCPPMGSMLYVTQTPQGGGGDTLFANTIRAYDALSPTMKAFTEGLNAVHDGSQPYSGGYGVASPEGGWPRNTHPVVIRHPETGEKALFVNRGFTSHIVELERRESDAVLEMLWRHIESRVDFHCRVQWTPNTLVFWDNRVTQHHAVWDYYPNSRYGQRISIVGTRPSR
jgi:taurine dioxygenase